METGRCGFDSPDQGWIAEFLCQVLQKVTKADLKTIHPLQLCTFTHTCGKAHRIAQGHTLDKHLANLGKAIQGRLQRGSIHFDPAALEKRQAFFGRKQLANFLLGDHLTLKPELRIGRKDRVQAKLGRCLFAYLQLKPRATPHRPPFRHPAQDSTFFKHGQRIEKLISLCNLPGQRLEQLSRVQQALDQWHTTRTCLHRRKQIDHPLAIAPVCL